MRKWMRVVRISNWAGLLAGSLLPPHPMLVCISISIENLYFLLELDNFYALGMKIGGPYNQAFNVEIHYYNPNLDSGVLDSSGLQVIITKKLRTYDIAMMRVSSVRYSNKNLKRLHILSNLVHTRYFYLPR